LVTKSFLLECNSELVCCWRYFLLICFSIILLILMYSVKCQWYFTLNYGCNSVLFISEYFLHTFSHLYKIYNTVPMFQACSFLVSSHGAVISEERELKENVFSIGNYVETPFLYEQVPCNISYYCGYLLLVSVNSFTSFFFFFFYFVLWCKWAINGLFYRKWRLHHQIILV